MKRLLFFLGVILAQTIIVPRLNILGTIPDLILVTVIIMALEQERPPATLIAAGLGFLQDLLSWGPLYNTIGKIIMANVVVSVKEDYSGEQKKLLAPLVLAASVALQLADTICLRVFDHANFSLYYFFFQLAAMPIYNLVAAYLLAMIWERVEHGKQ